ILGPLEAEGGEGLSERPVGRVEDLARRGRHGGRLLAHPDLLRALPRKDERDLASHGRVLFENRAPQSTGSTCARAPSARALASPQSARARARSDSRTG